MEEFSRSNTYDGGVRFFFSIVRQRKLSLSVAPAKRGPITTGHMLRDAGAPARNTTRFLGVVPVRR